MKILIDENMPYAATLFNQLGDVILKSGRDINADDLVDIDALMIRSVTKVDAKLLSKANRLKFVGTATAGTDHVDDSLLQQKGIYFTAAPGCNKVGVAEYVFSVLMVLSQQYGFSIFDKTVGIVGVGQVGSYLADCLQAVGINVLLNDPPLQQQGVDKPFIELDQLLEQADIVSLHTPLTVDGKWPSYHLLDQKRLQSLRCDQILINAARGAVVDNQALKKRLSQQDGFCAALDVFEFEPQVDRELLSLLTFATPHIAGYGLEGKARGTTMIFNHYCQFLSQLNKTIVSKGNKASKVNKANVESLLPVAPIPIVHLEQRWDQAILHNLTQLVYDVRRDDALFKRVMLIEQDDRAQAAAFDCMRKNYWDRREYSAITLIGEAKCDLVSLAKLGFKTEVIQ